ncbi:MAG TPA: ABC transporter substrate-binding protein [Stellaceae bacterium]|jgi:NitT/TauT family transport system substrate-binding protein|nr:ABC transporter substrate-binding protein [Stellaceae bacterium]
MKTLAALVFGSVAVAAWAANLISARAEDYSIKVGTGPVTASGPLYIAQDRGYFAAEHITAEMVSMDAAQSVAQGVVAGALDIGATAATAAAYNLGAKGGLKIIGGQGREVPTFHGSAIIASNEGWDKGVKSLKDLGGRHIGIVQVGGPIHYELELANAKYHIDPKSQSLVALQGLSNTASAVAGNQVDAAVEVSTFTLKLIDTQKAHLLAWVGDETPWQNTLLFVSAKAADEKKPMIEAFMRAYRKGAHDYYNAFTSPDGKRKDGPTAPAILAIMSKALSQSTEQLDQGISYDDPDAKLDMNDVRHQIAWFKEQNMIPADADADKMIDKRYAVPLN